MGKIAVFLNMVVYMYTEPDAPHHKPHCHVRYEGERAVLDTITGEVLAKSRNFPMVKIHAMQVWISMRQEELAKDWELACAGKNVVMISPLH